MNNVAEDVLLVIFTKNVPLTIFADGNCFKDVASMNFLRNTRLTLELRNISKLIPKKLEYNNYLEFE